MALDEAAAALAERLGDLLADRGLTADDLADVAGIDAGRLGRLLSGDRHAFPCPRELHRIAVTLGESVGALFGPE